MKIPFSLITLAAFSLLILDSCLEDQCESTRTFTEFRPVWLAVNALDEEISLTPSEDLVNPGKIYYYQNYILINEQYKGIHIIENQNPANPEKIAFLKIPGNIDMAVKEDVLYADNYKDILLIDLQNMEDPNIVHRIKDVKQPVFSEDFGGRYLLYYEPMESTVDLSCEDINFGNSFWFRNEGLFFDLAQSESGAFLNGGFIAPNVSAAAGGSSGGEGIAGSMARFALFGNHFYFVDEYSLHVYDVSDIRLPVFLNTVQMQWGIETIFPYKNNLFIGASNGMHIFDNTDPSNPSYLTTFEHAQACDPVVVEGTTAYITLRDGTECQNFTNQLDVVDISDITLPYLIRSYSMHNPHGLSVRNNILYLCDGDEGLKIFDAGDKREIDENKIAEVSNMHGYDVISVSQDLLLVIGQDGFYQFDVKDPKHPALLSQIPVQKS